MILLSVLLVSGCMQSEQESKGISAVDLLNPPTTHMEKKTSNKTSEYGGMEAEFKVPVATGYDWELTQSWAEHCQLCNDKGYNSIYSNFFGDYCTEMSHAASCPNACKYGWDFNLPGTEDLGKPVLSSGDGKVKSIAKNSWGNTVVIDHGSNICTRYAHMKDDSILVDEGQEVCQGLQIGEIGDTGGAVGAHLHFQFEECDSQTPLAKGFDDGNDVPVCTIGEDVYDAYGNYDLLILSNKQVDNCGEGPSDFGGTELQGTGWVKSSCGTLSGCPLIPNCKRQYGYQFKDHAQLDGATANAAAYLYSECVLDGKEDGKLHANDDITRAESLKIALQLFGLNSNCGSNVPFPDVHKSDWFFDTVACGLKHGIISASKNSFNPNMPVSMGEAAKMLAESASKADVIDLKNGSGYFSAVSASHWAYPYLRTLHYYGGLNGDLLSKSAESHVSRGQLIIMAASLSPCFCGNVICKDGCVCDQSVYACVDPQDQSPGVGGMKTPDKPDEPTDDEPGPTPELKPDLKAELSINCYVQLDDCRCEGTQTIIYIRCELQNNSSQILKVDDLMMSLNGQNSSCVVTDPQLDKGVGFQKLDPGQNKKLGGHFELSCSKMPSNPIVKTYLEMIEKVDDGSLVHHEKMFSPQISIPEQAFNKCKPVEIKFPKWKCDPAKGYEIHVSSWGGSYEAIAPSTSSYIKSDMAEGLAYPITFDCIDLPGAVLIHGAAKGLHVWTKDPNLPAFSVWFPFSFPITTTPPYNPDVSTTNFASQQGYVDVLFLLPPP